MKEEETHLNWVLIIEFQTLFPHKKIKNKKRIFCEKINRDSKHNKIEWKKHEIDNSKTTKLNQQNVKKKKKKQEEA